MEHQLSLLIILLLNLLSFDVNSQLDTVSVSKNAVYIEARGLGGYGSLNYERIVPLKKSISLGIRLGLSTYKIKDFMGKINPDIIVPISLNGLYGKKHKIEFGIGQTISSLVKIDYSSWTPHREVKFSTTFSIGYRYQKNTGGLIYRWSYTPIIEFNKYFRHWGGMSIGYAFKTK